MFCPYCKTQLPDGIQFCPKCGQNLTNSFVTTDNTNKYWNDVDSLNDANENQYLNAIREAKNNVRAKKVSVVRTIALFGMVVSVLILTVVALNTNCQKNLANVSQVLFQRF